MPTYYLCDGRCDAGECQTCDEARATSVLRGAQWRVASDIAGEICAQILGRSVCVEAYDADRLFRIAMLDEGWTKARAQKLYEAAYHLVQDIICSRAPACEHSHLDHTRPGNHCVACGAEVQPIIEYRAYDTVTEWLGPVRTALVDAEADATRHNAGCAQQGGYGSAIVVRQDPDAPGRCVTLEGQPVWPPHGRSCGSARWRP